MQRLHQPLREQARSHIGNAYSCGSEPASEGASSDSKILQRTHLLILRINNFDLLNHRFGQR